MSLAPRHCPDCSVLRRRAREAEDDLALANEKKAVFLRLIASLEQDIENLKTEVRRLLDGNFTQVEIHGFCHKLSTTVSREEFEAGCRSYQDQIYGEKA